ncbi:MAG: arsenosugar biosynthesis radical SAM protein ArsS [Chrysiogenetes bacterium]|nr:arsenosugar biosynthesis radical SAM protein ArsS [Chrysiogenetes bacterium]
MPATQPIQDIAVEPFAARARRECGGPLRRGALETLQINLGKLCNQTCAHCHVDAGPNRTEVMTRETVDACLALLDRVGATTVDLTGGAPELNPNFRYLVEECTRRGVRVMDRCNLTVLFEPGQEGLAEFLARHKVEIVSSLPCYSEDNVDKQRGRGVFEKSILALQKLNALGYGREGSGLILNLVYNPVGAHLPPPQVKLRADYRRELSEHFDIVFNDLFTITNMPIARYARFLEVTGELGAYMELLAASFNPANAAGLMCRSTLSVGWDGRLYDCDFNQMLEIPAAGARAVQDLAEDPEGAEIAVADHCYGCTAGAGSSCGGALS